MSRAVDAIPRQTLHDELVDRVRDLIVAGVLAPGSKVNEQALSERFGVSRTPLREVLRSLAMEGLVVLTPRRGATIAPMTRADLEEAFPIVGALEALAGELACARISDAEIARARRLQADLAAAHAARDRDGYRAANDAIHALILNAAANPTLERMIGALDGRVRRARILANISGARWADAVAEHAEILEALEARDGARVSALMRRHLSNKLTSIMSQIDA